MYLKQILIKGFKSFADKTILEFLPPNSASGSLPIVGIVGPNGSGKSNIADAVRWVLGEQGLKAVRGKKSEDVIFTGSARRGRTSGAETEITIINDDGRIPLETQEVSIARRLWRDGQSEYLLNNRASRLMDIQMLLAKAAFGKEGYSVIGQGQVDAILSASPEERKGLFDEATGIKPLQIKKDQTLKKLAATEENLWQAELLEQELAPRLRSLTRQVKRLEQRAEIEKELHELQSQYYGVLFAQSEKERKQTSETINKIQEELDPKTQALRALEEEMKKLEQQDTKPAELLNIQTAYEKLIASKQSLRDREFELKRKMLVVKKENVAAPISEIVEILEKIKKEIEAALTLPSPSGRGAGGEGQIRSILAAISSLISRLKGEKISTSPSVDNKELEKIIQDIGAIDADLENLKNKLQQVSQEAEQKKQSFFEVQKKLTAKQTEAHALEARLNNAKIELAKIETKSEALINEAKQDMGERFEQFTVHSSQFTDDRIVDISATLPEIQKLKRQLEFIGAVDEETVKEYKDVQERHGFLKTQIDDLQKSLQSMVVLLEDLDNTMKTQFEDSFEKINQEFGNYFKILFGGGQAKLSKIVIESADNPSQPPLNLRGGGVGLLQTERPSLLDRFTKNDSYRGVEIHATPPGKKLKSIAMLSGGEKALTSIALLSAILSLNPPPFVILDEVDAALDESNSARFAAILSEISHRTQFIVITHNRATMQACQALYGVTMGDDGVSKILSLKFEEAAVAAVS